MWHDGLGNLQGLFCLSAKQLGGQCLDASTVCAQFVMTVFVRTSNVRQGADGQ